MTLNSFRVSSFRLPACGSLGASDFDIRISCFSRHPLHRVLNFTGHSIDDVVNNPVIKNKVLGYYKLHKFVQRRCEIVDLEHQWNATA